jgi:hypothetical protein
VIRLASSGLWLGVGLAKMAALVWLIDEKWQQALLAQGWPCGCGACAAPELSPMRQP